MVIACIFEFESAILATTIISAISVGLSIYNLFQYHGITQIELLNILTKGV